MKRATLSILMAAILLITGCASPTAQPIEPTAAPTTAVPATETAPPPTPTATAAATATATITPTAEPTSTATPVPCLQVKLISEKVSPAKEAFAPESKITQSWTFQNVGTCAWDISKSKLIYKDGEKMHGDDTNEFVLSVHASPKSPIAPNGQVIVSISIKAPKTAGTYTETWGLVDQDGNEISVIGLEGKALATTIKAREKLPTNLVKIKFDKIIVSPESWTKERCKPQETVYEVTATVTGPANLPITFEWSTLGNTKMTKWSFDKTPWFGKGIFSDDGVFAPKTITIGPIYKDPTNVDIYLIIKVDGEVVGANGIRICKDGEFLK